MKRAKELLETIKGHDKRACPGCGEDLSKIALADIAYTFEPCECAAAKYRHLVETLWHRSCFQEHSTHSSVRGLQAMLRS